MGGFHCERGSQCFRDYVIVNIIGTMASLRKPGRDSSNLMSVDYEPGVGPQCFTLNHEAAFPPPPRSVLFFHRCWSTQREVGEVGGRGVKDPSSDPMARRCHQDCLNHFQAPWIQILAVYLALHEASQWWLWLLLLFWIEEAP